MTPSLKVARPASDISRVRAVIAEPPSLPANLISLSCTKAPIVKSEEDNKNLPTEVPPSDKNIPAPSASKNKSPATSNVKSLA